MNHISDQILAERRRKGAERSRRCYNNTSPERRKEIIAQKGSVRKKIYRDLKELVFQKLGRKCSCGFSDERALQIDHVHNDGFKHRKTASAIQVLKDVLADKEGRFQILCANCNTIKRVESGNESPV